MNLACVSRSVFTTCYSDLHKAEIQDWLSSLYSVHATFLLEEFWMPGQEWFCFVGLSTCFSRSGATPCFHNEVVCLILLDSSDTHNYKVLKQFFCGSAAWTCFGVTRVKASTSSPPLDSRRNRAHPCVKGNPLPTRTSVLCYDCLKISENLMSC